MALIPVVTTVRSEDWNSVYAFNKDTQLAFQKLGSAILGPTAAPTFSAVTLTGLTPSRMLYSNDLGTLTSIATLSSWIAGTENEIDVADDGDGTITLGIVNPLIVGKGGTGVATLTDHGILLGSGTDAITPLGVATNGQLPIGSTGSDPVLATLTAGDGITITEGAGSITIESNVVLGGVTENVDVAKDGGGTRTLIFVDGIYMGYSDEEIIPIAAGMPIGFLLTLTYAE